MYIGVHIKYVSDCIAYISVYIKCVGDCIVQYCGSPPFVRRVETLILLAHLVHGEVRVQPVGLL